MFDDIRGEFTGFTDYYYDKIFPYLLTHEQTRKTKVAKAFWVGGAITAISLGLAVWAFFIFDRFTYSSLIIFFGAAAAISIGNYQISHLRFDTKDFLMRSICEFLGWQYHAKIVTPPPLTSWLENRLLPRFDRGAFEDQISGQAYGAPFKLCEANLEKKSQSSRNSQKWVTVFRGLLIEIDFKKKFHGRTVVLRDAGFFNAKKKAGMKRVGLADPKFEKLFEAYGTDQVEARVLLTPTFMQRLVDLEALVRGKKARFGFWDGKLFIAIEAPQQFEAGSMLKPLIDTQRTEKLLRELDGVYNVVDGVLKPLGRAY